MAGEEIFIKKLVTKVCNHFFMDTSYQVFEKLEHIFNENALEDYRSWLIELTCRKIFNPPRSHSCSRSVNLVIVLFLPQFTVLTTHRCFVADFIKVHPVLILTPIITPPNHAI